MSNARDKRLLRRIAVHHLPLFAASAISVFLLYTTRPYPDVITRTSFATAYPALVLLIVTLWIGPWNVLRRKRTPVSSDLRRDIGIWAGVVGLVHTGFGLNVHQRGRPWLYFLYRKTEGRHLIPLRHDAFGFANYMGALATILLLVLFATSNDYTIRKLGTPRWKQLQRWNYLLFALAFAHTFGYQIGVEKQHGPSVVTVIACGAISIILQALGYLTRRKRTAKSTSAMDVTISV